MALRGAGGRRALALVLALTLILEMLAHQSYPSASAHGAVTPPPAVPPLLVLVDSAASPYSAYLREILDAEGVKDYEVSNLDALTDGGLLAERRAVLLGEASPSPLQVGLLDNFVTAGGGLVAMRPIAGLNATLGVTRQSTVTAEGYLQITDPTIGVGLYAETMQFHGTASHYGLAGATQVAELYGTRMATADRPAVTVADRGTGKAAMFAYDLARSVVLTRQGNPSNVGVDTDEDGVVRTNDLFKDWVDLERAHVPQADMQQRLLVRVLEHVMPQPLPRLWYFPDTAASVLVATSDAHGQADNDYRVMIDALDDLGASTTFFLQALPWAQHPAAETVEAWRAQGFAFGPHPYTDGGYGRDLESGYDSFASWYPAITPRTMRTHELRWSGWTTTASEAAELGAAMDFNFYQYGAWLTATSHAGYLSGSGRPMRFIEADGTILPIYQQHTLIVDEQVGPSIGLAGHTLEEAIAASRTAIDASVGGYHTPITTQFHVGYWTWRGIAAWTIETTRYALEQGLPSLTTEQWLAFTEQRAATAIAGSRWSAGINQLTFDVAAGGPGQTILLPMTHRGGRFLGLERDGRAVVTTTLTVNGADFAAAPATTGSFLAVYEDTEAPTVTGVSPVAGATGIAPNTQVVVTFSERMDHSAAENAFALAPSAVGSFSWDAAGKTLTFTPDAPLAAGTTYTATVAASATDRSGNPLATPATWSFTIVPGPAPSPSPSPSPSASASPSARPTASPSPTTAPSPSATPVAPSASSSPSPTTRPSASPWASPSAGPSGGPGPAGGGFSGWASQGGVLADAPAAAAFNGRLYAFAVGTDPANPAIRPLYVKSSPDGATWTGWASLGGNLTDAPAAAAFNGRLYVFAKGVDPQNPAIKPLYAKSSADGVVWTEWQSLGGNLTDAPAAAAFGGKLYAFAKGVDPLAPSVFPLYVKSSADGATFGGWQSLGGNLTAAPAAAAFGGRLYVFAKGIDGGVFPLYVRSSADGASFTGWANLGGNLTAAPAAASYTPSGGTATLAVLARGTDGALYLQTTADGANYGGWASLGGQLVGAPAAAGLGGRLYVLARWATDELYARHSTP